MWTPSVMHLDLSRRRVAAISFLSNIPTDNEPTEIRLDCLHNTHVLRDFQRKKRERRLHYQHIHQSKGSSGLSEVKNDAPVLLLAVDALGGGSRETEGAVETTVASTETMGAAERKPISWSRRSRIARKLTFDMTSDDLDMELQPQELPRNPSKPAEMNLQHLVEIAAPQLKVEESTSAAVEGPAGAFFHYERFSWKFLFSSCRCRVRKPESSFPRGQGDSSEFQDRRALTSSKLDDDRQLATSQDLGPNKILLGSSNESLGGNFSMNLATRLRKISGDMSENSSCSLKETKFFRARNASGEEGFQSRHRTHSGGTDERMVFVGGERKIPFAIFSVLSSYKSSCSSRGNRRHSWSRLSLRSDHRLELGLSRKHHANSFSKQLTSINDGAEAKEQTGAIGLDHQDDNQETSYNHLLNPTPVSVLHDQSSCVFEDNSGVQNQGCKAGNRHRHNSGEMGTNSSPNIANDYVEAMSRGDVWRKSSPVASYSPYALDGWLIAGKHRTLLPFTSYVTSVIEYVKPSELKRELNQKFKERFPQLHISLTKLRSIKREMKIIALVECCLDLLTLATAYVYFEMLVQKSVVNKMNRKICAGSCLILAAKLNDVKGAALSGLIERIENVFRVARKDLLASEFPILVSLEFAMHVPTWHVYPHYQRLLHDA